ncbi:hypothetical protein DL93DRAFT_2166804 [Clavulina sp. PMI_390]|nr:hypothetical protein DL93DRAFT_2166804 [Clavulina sp. PMI_390]
MSVRAAPPTASMSPLQSHPRRPPSTRPTTATPDRAGSYIIALYESRGIGREVGIASISRITGNVALSQVSDTHSYSKTLHYMHIHYPSAIIVLDSSLPPDASTRQSSVLVRYIEEEFPDVHVESVLRKYWNDTTGLAFISQLIVEDDDRAATLLSITKESFALCAVSAMFKYVQTRLHTTYAPKSLRIKWQPMEGTMLIDHDTAKNLELCSNNTGRKNKHSLFELLNHVLTPMGGRLLRITILAPTTVQRSIELRLDAVEEIVQAEDLYGSVKSSLKTMDKVDFDKLITSIIAQSPENQTINPRDASRHLVALLQLRNVVRCIPAICQSLSGTSSQILRTIGTILSDQRVIEIERILARSVNDDAGAGKRAGITAVNNKVYAIKANFNLMLDVARETFKENVSDIQELCSLLKAEHDLPLVLTYNESGGGFWLAIDKDELEGELPRGFINVSTKGDKWICTTLDLKKRNERLKDSLDEVLLLSDRTIQEIIEEIMENISVLYKASEAISVLDMIWAFSRASILNNYVRPQFTGTLAIKAGRHPILENIQSPGTYVPNDAYACVTSTFQIVQGPNMSGKSTYIRQLGLLALMATCGCFVPAEYASFRLHDALLTRLSNDDDPERHLSTFSNEMASSAMILSSATKDSLILVDELGRLSPSNGKNARGEITYIHPHRGTSSIDGLGIAFATAEKLIDLRAYCFFTTHFTDLAMILSRKPNVVNLHLAVQVLHHLDLNSNTGLELAKLADLSKDVMAEARRVAEQFDKLEVRKKLASKTTQAIARRKAILSLRTKLTQAYEYSTLPNQDLAKYLAKLQKDVVEVLGSVLESEE